MELFIDDQPVDASILDGIETVSEALKLLQERCCKEGELVTSIECDGEVVAAEAMEKLLATLVEDIGRLDVRMGTPKSLVLDAMRESATCLTQTEEVCREIAKLLTAGKMSEAIESLSRTLQVWQQIHDAVCKSIVMLGVDAESIVVNGASIARWMEKPKEVLTCVKEALEAKDFVLLADTLQYELGELTESWQDLVSRIAEIAEQDSPVGNAIN